jgi:hypothetical protein
MKDRCNHYSGVDEGFYCWKCVDEIISDHKDEVKKLRKQIIEEVFEEIEKEGYKFGVVMGERYFKLSLDDWKNVKKKLGEK